jgi:hypothetical protein
MKSIEPIISPLVKSHFPEFYVDEGPKFVDFVQQYYAWMETENQVLNVSRNLFDYKDIDNTSNSFIQYYKNKYLASFPLTSVANTQMVTKHSLDYYRSKGTERGVQLVLRGLYDEPSHVFYPSTDLFKTSHGTWVRPTYLELSVQERTKTYVGRQVVGADSGATAFVESLVRKRVNSKYIEVAYLSGVIGNFQTGEYITLTTDTNLANAPTVVGSLTSLTVVTGGANFAVGDIFTISSSHGKQGKARITEVNNETGKVYFTYVDALTSGGWGYSLAHANVIIASKMLSLSNVQNANASINTFSLFETLSQNLVSITYTTARPDNSNYAIGNVIENYYANGVVAANAIIVTSTPTTNTSGTIIIAPQTGNVSTVDTVFAIRGTGTTATFNANSGVANTTEFITTISPHTFANGDIVVYSTRTGNTALAALSEGAAYCIIGANSTALQLANTANGAAINLTAGLNQTGHVLTKSLGSGVITGYANRTATANVMGANAQYVGVVNIINPFIATPYANIVGSITNTTATVANVSTGTGASFKIGLLTDTESVFLTPDFLYSNNTQNVVFSTVNLNGNNSGAPLLYGSPQLLSTGDYANGGFGFVKYPASNMDSILLDCLRFDATTIGSIATIVGINPGAEYNVDPFTIVADTYVLGYNHYDYNMIITPLTGVFVYGEKIQQTYDSPALQLTVNNFSGTTANGTVSTTVLVGEKVYQSYANGVDRAFGLVVEAGISAGSGTIKLSNITGTFVPTSNASTIMKSQTSGGTANISTTAVTTFATTARAIVKEIANTSYLKLKRINLENTFQVGSTIIGTVSGATATVATIGEDFATLPVGLNANIVANVQVSNNTVKSLSVYDSGFGYVEQETVTLATEGSIFEVTAIVGLGKQGVAEGFFSSTKGFLDSDKKLHNNDYYQEFSYEVVTKIPFDKYIDVLKQITHVAGTKPFGRVEATSKIDTSATIINSIIIS